MSKKTILASYWADNQEQVNIAVADYEDLVRAKNKQAISEMIYHRFFERYIKPFIFSNKDYQKRYKNGFAMMANGCLLIESLESFYQGWETTQDRGDTVFKSFFRRFPSFKGFQKIPFYKNIRCGILHQAETTGGYKISRKGPIRDNQTKTINATKFLEQLHICLNEYQKELCQAEWDSEIWDNFRRKMRSIIRNCD